MFEEPDFNHSQKDQIIRESIKKVKREKEVLAKQMEKSLDVRLKEKMYAFDDEYWVVFELY